MKAIATLATLLLIHSASNAMCMASAFSLWPHSKEISPNSLFIIEGYGTSEKVILGLNKKHAVYLVSGEDTVGLSVVKIYEGQFMLTQAVVKPMSPLVPGKTYTINIDSLGEFDRNDFEYERARVSWTVTDTPDKQKPLWQEEPSYHSKAVQHYGCGPAVYVNFCARLADRSPVVVLAKVKEVATGTITEYYVTPGDGKIALGHGMCSGEFRFKQDAVYEVSFSLMDACGNVSTGQTKPLQFTGPVKSEGDEKPCNTGNAQQGAAGFTLVMGAAGMVTLIVFMLGFYFMLRNFSGRRNRQSSLRVGSRHLWKERPHYYR